MGVHNRRPSPASMETRKEETGREKEGKREEKGDCESQMEERRDIVSQLFNYDLYEALQIVFLSLDSISLKRARCVCHEWDSFIQKPLWASTPARRRLRSRLVNQWEENEPLVRRVDTNFSGVTFLAAD